jgi:hypothetical protein
MVYVCLLLAKVAESTPVVDRSTTQRADGTNSHLSHSLYLILLLAPSFMIPTMPLVGITILIVLGLVGITFYVRATSSVDSKRKRTGKYRESFSCRDASRVGRTSLHADGELGDFNSSENYSLSQYGGGHSSDLLSDYEIAYPATAKLSPVENKRILSPVFPLPHISRHSFTATAEHVP